MKEGERVAGAFQTTRDIFDNPIWLNIVEFRLFFLIYGKAAFTDGVRVGNIELKRGQWIRSYRNLQRDLEYIENHAVKQYSLSAIKRAIDNLVKQERVTVQPCELGTLFTVVNYDKYQCLNNYKDEHETENEQRKNGERTDGEQIENNNKNTKNTKNSKKSNNNIFIPPTLEEVTSYCKERNNSVDPQRFIDFYSAKGWMIGKNKMKDWKAAVRTWERRDSEKNTQDFAKKYDYDGGDTL